MKEFVVSLDIIMSTADTSAVADRMGLDISIIHSRDIGNNNTLWRIESTVKSERSILEQLKSILSKFNTVALSSMRGAKMYIVIGVFYDTASCTVELNQDCLEILRTSGAAIEITCYPVGEPPSRKNREE